MVDWYTKAVLTVIAACLVWNIISSAPVRSASAQSGPVHVIVDEVSQFAFQFVTVPVRMRQ
jgi:hypothetical protein